MNLPLDTTERAPAGLNFHEVLLSFFKHKWKVILCTLAGFAAAAVVWFAHVPTYESQAKVLVKYVMDITPDTDKSLPNYNESFIEPEIEILTSWDIAHAVVDKIGADRIVKTVSNADPATVAAYQIKTNLEATAAKGSKVIEVTYRHTDPAIAVQVLNEVLVRYEDAHGKFHRSTGLNEGVDKQQSSIQARLDEIKKDLKNLKDKANINNLAESAASINKMMTDTRLDLQNVSVKLQAQRAKVAELEKMLGVAQSTPSEAGHKESPAGPSGFEVQDYQTLVQQRERLRQREDELLTRFEEGSKQVQAIREQIKQCDLDLAERRKATPSLANMAGPNLTGTSTGLQGERPRFDLAGERAEMVALEAQQAALTGDDVKIEREWKEFREVAPQIDRLEKDKDLQEENLRARVLKSEARADEAYDSKNMPNIDVIQQPSPPTAANQKLLKIVLGLAFGGLGAGFVLVFILEFLIDQSVRRPLEIETRMGIPLIMAIPDQSSAILTRRGRGAVTKNAEVVPWQEGHFIRPFAEAIRDRLVLYFEQSGLVRKPKLVGLTGWKMGAGASTIASGLAAALSETGDGKVLLVDMNVRGGEIHPFFKGEAATTLPEALRASSNLQSAAENLYLATATTDNGEVEIIPRRFYSMLPNFKASDYDYIIFDMPPLGKGSMTLAMAGFMDKMLLVVEAEKDNRNVLKRACSELVGAKANLCGVLNKVRYYGPRWLQAGV